MKGATQYGGIAAVQSIKLNFDGLKAAFYVFIVIYRLLVL